MPIWAGGRLEPSPSSTPYQASLRLHERAKQFSACFARTAPAAPLQRRRQRCWQRSCSGSGSVHSKAAVLTLATIWCEAGAGRSVAQCSSKLACFKGPHCCSAVASSVKNWALGGGLYKIATWPYGPLCQLLAVDGCRMFYWNQSASFIVIWADSSLSAPTWREWYLGRMRPPGETED